MLVGKTAEYLIPKLNVVNLIAKARTRVPQRANKRVEMDKGAGMGGSYTSIRS